MNLALCQDSSVTWTLIIPNNAIASFHLLPAADMKNDFYSQLLYVAGEVNVAAAGRHSDEENCFAA